MSAYTDNFDSSYDAFGNATSSAANGVYQDASAGQLNSALPNLVGGYTAPSAIQGNGLSAPVTLGDFNKANSSVTIDPTQDMQSALNVLNQYGGGTLYMQAGTYRLPSTVVGYSSIKIVGVSPTETILNFLGAGNFLSFAGSSVYSTGTITAISSSVNVTGSGTSWLANVHPGQTLFLGTRSYVIAAVTDDTHLILAEGYGDNVTLPSSYRITTQCTDIGIMGVGFEGSTTTAVQFADARRITIENIQSLGNGSGISFTNCSEVFTNRISVASSTGAGVVATNMGLCDWQSVNSNANTGNGFTFSNVKDMGLVPGEAAGNGGDGMNLTTVVNLTAICACSGNGGQGVELVSGCDNCDFISGTLQGNTSDGIKFTASATNCHIFGCDITGNGGYGANVAASSDQNIIFTTNNFAGNSSGAINDTGTLTLIRGNSGVSDNSNGAFVQAGLFGDGSDGSVTISVNTTLSADKHYSSLTVNNGVTLTTAGYKIFCTGTVTNNGTIDNSGGVGGNGGNGGASSGGSGGTAGTGAPGGTLPSGGDGVAGTAGNCIPLNSQPATPGVTGTSVNPSLGSSGTAGGGGGAAGDGDSNSSGGAGGTATSENLSTSVPAYGASGTITAGVEKTLSVLITPSGSTSGTTLSKSASGGSGGAGAADSNSSGTVSSGGGGGSGGNGGWVFIAAATLVNNGTISSNGGKGGNGGATGGFASGHAGGSGGGAGGTGGIVFLIYETLTAGTISVAGGTGGTGSSGRATGSAGGSGSTGGTGKIYKLKLTTTA